MLRNSNFPISALPLNTYFEHMVTLLSVRVKAFLEGTLSSSPSTCQPKGVILEMCYHPVLWMRIAQPASDSGWKVILGGGGIELVGSRTGSTMD